MSEPNNVEVVAQEYDNGKIAGGLTTDPEAPVYVELTRQDGQTVFLKLRPDELASLAWICNGVLFSLLVTEHIDHDQSDDQPRTE